MPEGLTRGIRVKGITCRYVRKTGTVDSNVCGQTVDFPGQMAKGHGLLLDDGDWIMLRQD